MSFGDILLLIVLFHFKWFVKYSVPHKVYWYSCLILSVREDVSSSLLCLLISALLHFKYLQQLNLPVFAPVSVFKAKFRHGVCYSEQFKRSLQILPGLFIPPLSRYNIICNLDTKELQEHFNLNNRDSSFIYTYSWALIMKAVVSWIDIWWTKGNCFQWKRKIVLQ